MTTQHHDLTSDFERCRRFRDARVRRRLARVFGRVVWERLLDDQLTQSVAVDLLVVGVRHRLSVLLPFDHRRLGVTFQTTFEREPVTHV